MPPTGSPLARKRSLGRTDGAVVMGCGLDVFASGVYLAVYKAAPLKATPQLETLDEVISNFQRLPLRSPAYTTSGIPSELMSTKRGMDNPLSLALSPVDAAGMR